jgi:hypothetical protein
MVVTTRFPRFQSTAGEEAISVPTRRFQRTFPERIEIARSVPWMLLM